MLKDGVPHVKQGRPRGSKQKVTIQSKLEAQAAGLLPHEWLLKVSRGEPIMHKRWEITRDKKTGKEISRTLVVEEVYTDFATRIDCAKAAAPYYAPRLATQQVNFGKGPLPVMQVPMVASVEEWERIAMDSQAKLKEDVKS